MKNHYPDLFLTALRAEREHARSSPKRFPSRASSSRPALTTANHVLERANPDAATACLVSVQTGPIVGKDQNFGRL